MAIITAAERGRTISKPITVSGTLLNFVTYYIHLYTCTAFNMPLGYTEAI